jgi:hypothetical protein
MPSRLGAIRVLGNMIQKTGMWHDSKIRVNGLYESQESDINELKKSVLVSVHHFSLKCTEYPFFCETLKLRAVLMGHVHDDREVGRELTLPLVQFDAGLSRTL